MSNTKLLLAICAIFAYSANVLAQSVPQSQSLNRLLIKETEQRLSDLGYWTGRIDGVWDRASRQALIAFQKHELRPVTGKLTHNELEAIRTASSPRARELGYQHVEIDIDLQILMVVGADGGIKVLPVSTGSNQPFVDDGETSIAYTPRGRFLVYDKEVGGNPGELGEAFYANYISGGVAIHGYRTVPSTPASHGCIRVPMFAARELSRLLPVGTIVLVYDKVSFVSAMPWVKDPKLKAEALRHTTIEHIDYVPVARSSSVSKAKQSSPASRSIANKRVRPRSIRA